MTTISSSGLPTLNKILYVRECLDLDKMLKGGFDAQLTPLNDSEKKALQEEKWAPTLNKLFDSLSNEDKLAFIQIFGLKGSSGQDLAADDLDGSVISEKILTDKYSTKDLMASIRKMQANRSRFSNSEAITVFSKILYVRECLDLDKMLKGGFDAQPTPLNDSEKKALQEEKWAPTLNKLFDSLSNEDKLAFIQIFDLKGSSGQDLAADDLDGSVISEKILTDKYSSRDLQVAFCKMGQNDYCLNIEEVEPQTITQSNQTQEVDLSIKGNNFTNDFTVQFLQSNGPVDTNIEIVDNDVTCSDDGKTLSVKVKIGENAALGKRDVTVSTRDNFLMAKKIEGFEITASITPPLNCTDGIDNDSDSLIDAADSDCTPGGKGEIPAPVAEQKRKISIAEAASFVHKNELEIGTGFTTGNAAASPALEDRLTKNFSAKLGYVPLRWQISKDADLSLKLGAEYSVNASKSQDVNPSAGVMAKYLPMDELQLFASADYQYQQKNFKSPTLLYPNAKDHGLGARIGIGTDLNKVSGALVFSHKYSWLNHRTSGLLGLDTLSYGGNEQTDNLGLYVNWDIAQTFGLSSSWIPALKVNGQYTLFGKTNVPNIRALNNNLVSHIQEAKGLTEYSFGVSLDWENVSLFTNLSNRKVRGWDSERIINAGAKYSSEKMGDITLAYNNMRLDPSNPKTVNGAQASWTIPIWNRAVTLSAHTYNFGIGLSIDLLRAMDIDLPGSTLDTSDKAAPAPAPSAPSPSDRASAARE